MSVVTGNIRTIKNGVMLCVDPSSGSEGSHIGYALYEAGILIEAGEIDMKAHWNEPVSKRLFSINECLKREFTNEVDLLVVEKIRAVSRGKAYTANHQLMWSVGTILASIPHKKAVEIHPRTWQSIVLRLWDKYTKGDMNDAIGIGVGMIALAYGFNPKKWQNKNQQETNDLVREKLREALT